jgi:MFS family permease
MNMSAARNRLGRSWFAFLLAHAFILQALVMMLRVGTTYQAVSIGLNGFWIGVIGGAFGVFPAILGLHVGRFIDRLGEQVSLIAGSVFMMAAAVVFWLVGSTLPALAVASALLGLGQFLCIAGQHSAVARTATEGRRDVNFGRLTVAISLAQAVGPMIVGFFGRDTLVPDTNAIFVAGIISSIVLLLVGCLTLMPPQVPEPTGHGAWRTARILLGTKGFLLSAVAALVIFSAMDLLVIYLPLYGAERGIEADTIGILLALRAVASMLSRLLFGWLLSRLGRARLLVFAMVLAGASIALLPLSEVPALMGALLFMTGLGLGIGAPLTLAWVSEIAPPGMRASGLSLRLAINRLGQAALPIIVGVAVSGIGAAGVLFATAATLLSTSAISAQYFKAVRNKALTG